MKRAGTLQYRSGYVCMSKHIKKRRSILKYDDILTPLEYLLEIMGERFFEDMFVGHMVILRTTHLFTKYAIYCNIKKKLFYLIFDDQLLPKASIMHW